MKDKKLLILNGPGLSDAGGGDALPQVAQACAALCARHGLDVEFRQTNNADELSRWIATDSHQFDALIINPCSDTDAQTVDCAAYRAAIDVLAQRKQPVVEVRMTNIFRTGNAAAAPMHGPAGQTGFVCGLGQNGYLLAINAIAQRLRP